MNAVSHLLDLVIAQGTALAVVISRSAEVKVNFLVRITVSA